MDDKTFIAKYVADESTRIKEQFKKMMLSEIPPTEEEKAVMMEDIKSTLTRLQAALAQVTSETADKDSEDHGEPS